MSMIYNDAVRKGWSRAAAEIREPLRKQMKANSGVDLDSLIKYMYTNNIDHVKFDPTEPRMKRVGSF